MNFFHQIPATFCIAAHRGYRACYPENTLCAFEAALGRCDFIELDVRFSSDGVPVVFHDPNLQRTSNASEFENSLQSLRICDWSLRELRQLDAGSWFLASDPFGTLASGLADRENLKQCMPEPILSLTELMEWVRRKNIPVNLEMKDSSYSGRKRSPVEVVLDILGKTSTEDLVLMSSFNHEYLREWWHLCPKIPTAALVGDSHPADDLVSYLHRIGASAYHCSEALVDGNLVETLSRSGIKTGVYTVNDRQRMQKLFKLGVYAVFTDFL